MQVLTVWVMILVAMSMSAMGHAQTAVTVSHALAMHGQPKYGPDFMHFDYVNPQAPRGGMIRLADDGTFDSFNPFIPKGNPAIGPNYFESLLESSADEPFTMYGLIAESASIMGSATWLP